MSNRINRPFDPTQHEQRGMDRYRDIARQMADPATGDQGFRTQSQQSRASADRGGRQPAAPVTLPSELDIQAANTQAAQPSDTMDPAGKLSGAGEDGPASRASSPGMSVREVSPQSMLDTYRQYRRPMDLRGLGQGGGIVPGAGA